MKTKTKLKNIYVDERKVYKVGFIDNNTNSFVGFMLPGNSYKLPDDFYFSKYFGGLKWKKL